MTDEEKRQRLLEITDRERMEPKEDKDLELFKKLVAEGMEKTWPEALEIVAYACYGGNDVYGEDWELSRDCLLKLIEISDNPSPAFYNTLGYIYYYGRCNNGLPEYGQAFRYFSVGAWSGVYESRYKLADMFLEGKGCPKNVEAAVNMVSQMYEECLEDFCEGETDGKLADITLRLGSFYLEGKGVEKNPEKALTLLLISDYAIKLRMENGEYYGDKKVARSITTALEKAKKAMPEDFYKDRIEAPAPFLVGELLRASNSGICTWFFEKEGQMYLYAEMIPMILDENMKDTELSQKAFTDNKQYLMVIPSMKFCSLTNQVIMRVEGLEELESPNKEMQAIVNHIEYNKEENVWLFCTLEQVVFQLKCKGFSFEL